MMFVEWILLNCGSPFTVCPIKEDITSPTPDPETHQNLAMPIMDLEPGPTTDTKPALMPMPEPMHEPNIAPEPELNNESDLVHELATLFCEEGILVKYGDVVGSSGDGAPLC